MRRSGKSKAGFTPPWRSAQKVFWPSWRSAQQGFWPSWRSAQQGFTLVEVLVALVVTSLILAIVMNGALQAKTRSVGAREKERAVMLARGLIAGRAAAPYDNATRAGEESGLRWSMPRQGSRPIRAGFCSFPKSMSRCAIPTERSCPSCSSASSRRRRSHEREPGFTPSRRSAEHGSGLRGVPPNTASRLSSFSSPWSRDRCCSPV